MMQYGFYFDQSRCTGCQTCAVACKNWHGLPPGPVKYLKVYEYEKGGFADLRVHFQWIPCYHCEDPACVSVCLCQAISKEPKYGAVLVNKEKCDGCRVCYDVCPYGAPAFESDDPRSKMQKCTMCVDRIDAGEKPICVLACPYRALDFQPLVVLKSKYGENRDLEDLPEGSMTRPSVIFKPHSAKKRLVPYDTRRAVELMMKRDPLPSLFDSAEDVLEVPEQTISRSRLVIRHNSVEELMRRTRNDEG
jgi:anaerobic dimethyl sulfoxide reductase subunit B (iron-sulfur subunit)